MYIFIYISTYFIIFKNLFFSILYVFLITLIRNIVSTTFKANSKILLSSRPSSHVLVQNPWLKCYPCPSESLREIACDPRGKLVGNSECPAPPCHSWAKWHSSWKSLKITLKTKRTLCRHMRVGEFVCWWVVFWHAENVVDSFNGISGCVSGKVCQMIKRTRQICARVVE